MANLDKAKRTVPVEDSVDDSAQVSELELPEVDIDELDLSDDADAEDEDSEESSKDDPLLDDEDEVVPEQPKSNIRSKEDRKIQALKAEAKKLASEKAELQKRLDERQEEKQIDSLKKKYVKDGYEEDTAENMAKTDLKQSKLEERLNILEFKENNADVIARYPKAKDELRKIMTIASDGTMTVEQVCRGLYGQESPEREKRAKDAVLGNAARPESDNTVSSAVRTSSPRTTISLSDKELKAKRYIEKTYNGGKSISEEDFIKVYRT